MQSNKYRILQKLLVTLWHDERSFRIRFILGISLMFMATGMNLMLPWYLKWVVDKLSIKSFHTAIIYLLGAYGLIWILAQVLACVRQILAYSMFENGVHKLGMEVFEKLLTLPLSYHINKSTGGLMNAIERAQAALPDILFGLVFVVIPMIIEIVIIIGSINYHYEFKFTLILLTLFASYFLFTWSSIGWVVEAQRKGNHEHKNVSSFIADILMNIEYIHYQNYHNMAIKECRKNMIAREDAITNQLVKIDMIYLGQIAIAGVGFTILIILVGKDIANGKLAVSDFVLFNGCLIQFLVPLNAIGSSVLRRIREGITHMEDVMDIMMVPTTTLFQKENGATLPDYPVSIEFRNIAFKYPDTKNYALKDVNFTVLARKTVAIVGPNGSGKSTIAKLLYRLYEPLIGSILINNQDIKDFNLSSLRNYIGVVPQETLLLNDTLYNNLSLGSDIQIDSPFFQEIMGKVKIDDWARSLPEGYNTQVGERGDKLSGGERQRIALARALLKNPRILILDEATSALDEIIENEFFNQLNQNFNHISKIIITHNPKNLAFADAVISLDKKLIGYNNSYCAIETENLYLTN